VPPHAPAGVGLRLTVISTTDEQQEFNLTNNEIPTKFDRAKEDLPGRKDTFQIKLPEGFEPAAVAEVFVDVPEGHWKRGHDSVYIKKVTFTGEKGVQVHILANSYVRNSQGGRLFVRDDALTNPALKGNSVIASLQAAELKDLRGEGKNQNQAIDEPRKEGDRIYRYATYNDLGGDILRYPALARPALGGGKGLPYPRRLDTNRGVYPGTDAEKVPDAGGSVLVSTQVIDSTLSRLPGLLAPLARLVLRIVGGPLHFVKRIMGKTVPEGLVPSPWVPEDDNFDIDKTQGFIGNAITGILPGLLTTLDVALGPVSFIGPILRLLGLSAGREFKNVGDVLSLYDKDELRELKGQEGAMASVVPGGAGNFGTQLQRNIPKKLDAQINSRTGDKVEPQRTGRSSSSAREAGPADIDDDDGVLDLLEYNVPRCLVNRLDTWDTDEEFGRMFLAGQNPVVLEVLGVARLDALMESSPGIKEADGLIKGELEGKPLSEWALAGESSEPRLFIVDYWLVYDALDELEDANKGKESVMHAGRALLFRRSNAKLVPVIIELANSKRQPSVVYTPRDPPAVWQVAKAIFLSVDCGWHQLISHWLRTHACAEPYLIATRRQLPVTHPVFRLLMPHFRYTLPINAAARGALINADGTIEGNFSPSVFSMRLSSVVYGAKWRFKDEGLVADLGKRGFLDASGNLRVSDYPYAEDGLLLWNALSKYFTSYVDLYYDGDEDVRGDTLLQKWWTDITTQAHPDAAKEGWIDLTSKASLVLITTTIAWVSSAHHAAVNFGQYDYAGWMPSHASLTRRPAPRRGEKEWKALASRELSSSEFFSYLSLPTSTTKVMSTIKLLSAHADDEQYLSTDTHDWLPLYEPQVKKLFDEFVSEITNTVEPEINARNADPSNISRNPATNGLPYTLLLPSSGPRVTMQGVPYSVSI